MTQTGPYNGADAPQVDRDGYIGAKRLRRATNTRNAKRATQGEDPLWPSQVYLDAVWNSSLTSTQKITALCYGNHANEKTSPTRDRAWVIRERLMQQTGIRSRDTIAKANADLVRLGWLEPFGHRPGHKQINVYLLALPATETGPEIVTSPETMTGHDFSQNQSQFSPKPVRKSARTGHRTGTRLSTDPPQDSPTDSPQAHGADRVVAAYIDGATNAGRPRPTGGLVGKVGRTARKLISDGIGLDALATAANAMGRDGWSDLEIQLQRMTVGKPSASTPPRNGYQPYRNPDPSEYRKGSL